MSDNLILHHYENSPYAEKIRLMFGLMDMQWQSLLAPVWPPRPNLDPLTGGYRRIPVAQMGADLFCDTSLIAHELAQLTGNSWLDPKNIDGTAAALMERAESDVFFSAVAAVPQLRLVGTMLRQFGPFGTYKFAKDRMGMLKGGTSRAPSPAKAQHILSSFLDDLEAHLSDSDWLVGEHVSVADFAVYHPIWLHLSCARRDLEAGPKTTRWYNAVSGIGEGQRHELNAEQVFNIARDATPRDLPDSPSDELGLELGQAVSIAPSDYGVDAITGTLAHQSENRVIIARETEDYGLLHVHFPREGYSLKAIS